MNADPSYRVRVTASARHEESIVAIESDDVSVRELLNALAEGAPVTRVPWGSSITGVIGERLLRTTTGPLGRSTGRAVARGLALLTGVALAASSGLAAARSTGMSTSRSQRASSPRIASRRVTLATSPDQAELASQLPMPRFYLATGDFTATEWAPARVLEAERRLVADCRAVFAVSSGLADTLSERHGIPRDQITVLPNAVPADLIPHEAPVPHVQTDSRPVAGVLGSLSSRLRLDWLREWVEATPWLQWRFVGGIEQSELAPGDRFHLRWLEQHPRCRFEGPRPYRELVQYATTLDVAVMPYSTRASNMLGSPSRLFAHLAAGHPILATPGCNQVGELAGSLVTTCDEPGALIAKLEQLREQGFDDGLHRARWELAQHHTWAQRAELFRATISKL